MDQVITFMNRQQEPLTTGNEKPLTPSMINNYVKDEVLPRPEKKKYSRTHIAMLQLICSLKAVLSLPEIDALLKGITEDREMSDCYTDYVEAQTKAVDAMVESLRSVSEQSREARFQMALELALEANARRFAVAHILSSLEPPITEKESSKKDKDKEKDKEKD